MTPKQGSLLGFVEKVNQELLVFFNSNYAGKVAGNIQTDSSGHKQISIYFDKKAHKAHRLAWIYVYGKVPKGIIDHINGDSLDNRIVNLREADDFQSAWNKVSQSPINLGTRVQVLRRSLVSGSHR